MKAVGREKTPPKLYNDLISTWEAFLALSSSRNFFESIKFSEIESYLNLNNIFDEDIRMEMTHLIRIMDIEYIKYMKEKYAKS